MAGKSFSTAAGVGKPIEFEIDGIQLYAHPEIAASTMLRMMEATAGNDAVSGPDTVRLIVDFYRTALLPESYKIFTEMLEGTEHVISMTLLTDLSEWLIGEMTQRPTGEPSLSTSSQTPSGSGSTVGVLPGRSMFSRPDREGSLRPVS